MLNTCPDKSMTNCKQGEVRRHEEVGSTSQPEVQNSKGPAEPVQRTKRFTAYIGFRVLLSQALTNCVEITIGHASKKLA